MPTTGETGIRDQKVADAFGSDPSAPDHALGSPTDSHHDVEMPEVEYGGRQLLQCIEAMLDGSIDRILRVFSDKLAYDASKQLQIDRLHEELQQHRSDLAAQAALPLVRGMIRVHDDIGKLHGALEAKFDDEFSLEKFLRILKSLQEDVELVLEQNGACAYREPGKSFDPKRQRILRTVPTEDQGLAGSVAESTRPGFELNSRIIEKERVSTYVFAAPSPEPIQSAFSNPIVSRIDT